MCLRYPPRPAWLVLTSLGGLLLAGCQGTARSGPIDGNSSEEEGAAATASIGAPLYAPLPTPPVPPPRLGNEPIIISPAFVQYEDRQQVAAEVDGKIELIAAPLFQRPDGRYEWRPADGDPILYDPDHPHPNIVFHPRDPDRKYPYWKLREGDAVQAGQTVCLLDDQLVQNRLETAIKHRNAAMEIRRHAQAGVENAQKKIDLYRNNPTTSIPPATMLDDQIMLSRFQENFAQATFEIVKAEQEQKEAELLLEKHRVTVSLNGIIRNIAKKPGEFVKAGEKIMEIQSTDKVRLEGNLDVQYAGRLRRHMEVLVEPARPDAPAISYYAHRQPTVGVAVTGHADRPLIVSVGLDGTAVIWDASAEPGSGLTHNLPHPVPVRAVASSPWNAPKQWIVTGAEDGRLRIWDLTDPNQLPLRPRLEPDTYHLTAVTSVAISPDNRFAASSAGREVFIWNLADGQKLYSLPPEHRDTVSAVVFTPQSQLVTVSWDRTIKVWRLGQQGAVVERTFEHRAGLMDVLGVSPDGQRILFDHDKNRLDLLQLGDGQTVGQITQSPPGHSIAGFAIFGPDESDPQTPAEQLPPYLIATGGGEGELKGVVQLWRLPRSGGRAAAVARCITPGQPAVTCAAFSPNPRRRFLVIGTDKGSVHLWPLPSNDSPTSKGRILSFDAADPRFLTVRVELDNRTLRLLDKSSVTVIIPPSKN